MALDTPRILIASNDSTLVTDLCALLETSSQVTVVETFDDALSEAISGQYSVLVTSVALAPLSGVDLLAAIEALHLHLPAILLDDVMSARAAIAALRLGALDYLYKPYSYEFIVMRVMNALRKPASESADTESNSKAKQPRVPTRREWIDHSKRPATFILRRQQFIEINHILSVLQQQTTASFCGLVDEAHNIVSAAGDLHHADLISLRRVLAEDYGSGHLADVLHEKQFSHAYFEGEHKSIFITDFGELHPVSLVIICPADAKAGVVWLWSKRTAAVIEALLKKADENHHELHIEENPSA